MRECVCACGCGCVHVCVGVSIGQDTLHSVHLCTENALYGIQRMANNREALSECECLLSYSALPVPVELPSN